MIDFICKNPGSIICALQLLLQNQKMNEFLFLCYSSIPSFFGFFSTNEHLTYAFPFYCSLVGTANEQIVENALIPFYCNSCTFRFIENIFHSFGTSFCHDMRFNSKTIQKEYLKKCATPLIAAIIDSYQLLPQSHQFLIKFMKVRGWTNQKVLKFFIQDFVLAQLLRFMKTTPFQLHYEQLLYFSNNIDIKEFDPLMKIFSKGKSFLEIPSAYTVFDLFYVQLLTTTADVKAVVSALIDCGEAPQCVHQFVETAPLAVINYESFWIRFYSRKPKPADLSFNWRPVVFNSVKIEPTANLVNNNEFERRFRKSSSNMDFVEEDFLDEKDDKDYNDFLEQQKIIDFNQKAKVFEQYLVNEMFSIELKRYLDVVDAYYTSTILPITADHLLNILKSRVDPTAKCIARVLDESLNSVDSPQVLQLLFMMIIQYIVPNVVPANRLSRLQYFEAEWQNLVDEIREDIVLPEMFRNRKGNEKTALFLHRKLWASIEHFRCIQNMKFEWTLKIIFDSIGQLDEILRLDDEAGGVIQFVLAVSDCPVLISRFLIINAFVAKQKIFHSMTTANRDLLFWSRLENAILKLLSKNETLMTEFLEFQDELMHYQFTNVFCEMESDE